LGGNPYLGVWSMLDLKQLIVVDPFCETELMANISMITDIGIKTPGPGKYRTRVSKIASTSSKS
jgi:hypothetical protein